MLIRLEEDFRIKEQVEKVLSMQLRREVLALPGFQMGVASLASGARTGLPTVVAAKIAHLPPTSALFAAFLGYNPMGTLIPANVLQALPAAKQAVLLGHSYFPNLISPPFSLGLHNVFYLSAAMCLVAAFVSMLRGKQNTVSRGAVSENGNVDTAKQQVAAASDID